MDRFDIENDQLCMGVGELNTRPLHPRDTEGVYLTLIGPSRHDNFGNCDEGFTNEADF